MIVPYTEVPIPCVETPRDPALGRYLQEIKGFAIPGVIIEDSGPDMQAARQALWPALESELHAQMDDLPPLAICIGNDAAHTEGQRDRGLHMDARPGRAQQKFINLNLYRMDVGGAQVRLTLAAPTFMDMLYASGPEYSAGVPLPAGTRALYAEGKVDDKVLSPELYVGELAARAMVIFNFTGHRPAAHDFISRTAFRTSEVTTARFPITL